MLLAIDVGNTNTVLGVFDRSTLRDSFRVQTEKDRTGDEYGLQLRALFDFANLKMSEVHDVIISSVVPPMVFPLEQMSKRFFGKKPLFVGPGVKTGMPVLYDNPREVGADRIVNAVAAYEKWPTGLVIVDFGTATTFDAVTPKGEYLGGAISPGSISRGARRAARRDQGRAADADLAGAVESDHAGAGAGGAGAGPPRRARSRHRRGPLAAGDGPQGRARDLHQGLASQPERPAHP